MVRRPSFEFFRRKVPVKGDRGFDGSMGPSGPTGNMGPTGPAGLPNITSFSLSPGRSLNSTFTPHATRPTMVVYGVRLHTQLSALGTSIAQCDLCSDDTASPTAVVNTARLSDQLTVGLSVGQVTEVTCNVACLVPAGQKVRLNTTTSNGGTVTLVNQMEVVL